LFLVVLPFLPASVVAQTTAHHGFIAAGWQLAKSIPDKGAQDIADTGTWRGVELAWAPHAVVSLTSMQTSSQWYFSSYSLRLTTVGLYLPIYRDWYLGGGIGKVDVDREGCHWGCSSDHRRGGVIEAAALWSNHARATPLHLSFKVGVRSADEAGGTSALLALLLGVNL